jgi:aromatic-L-amino-acid decarboxylase
MSVDEFRETAARVAAWVANYREHVTDFPVRARVKPGDVSALIPPAPPALGEPIAALLEDLDRIILPGLTHWNHPGFLAYFASSASGPGVLAEFVAAALGVNAMLWRTSPAATELEERTTDWLRQAVGLPDSFHGVIQDTASSASFTALLAAREDARLEVRELGLAGRQDLPVLTVYVSEQAHSSLEKAAIAAGLGQVNVHKIPTDSAFRMDPDALVRTLNRDRSEGRRPIFVCATVGTTSTASVDPVERIADIAGAQDLWLHVDAAYAGPAAMLPELQERFAGWERADSIVLNPHKWLGTPLDCSVFFFRRPDVLRASLALTPEYLRTEVEGVTNLMDYGLPLGRRFRALKLWFLFRYFGTDALQQMLRGHIALAQQFAERIEADPRFELTAPASFSTVCFRALVAGEAGSEQDVDRLNHDLLEAVNAEGRVFLSHTELADRTTLRLSVGSVHNREEDVDAAFASLDRALRALTGGK